MWRVQFNVRTRINFSPNRKCSEKVTLENEINDDFAEEADYRYLLDDKKRKKNYQPPRFDDARLWGIDETEETDKRPKEQ